MTQLVPQPAPSELMRYRTVKQWLATYGLTNSEVRKLISCGTIKPKVLGKNGHRAWYRASQIERDVLA